jgi:hypothetical protein
MKILKKLDVFFFNKEALDQNINAVQIITKALD